MPCISRGGAGLGKHGWSVADVWCFTSGSDSSRRSLGCTPALDCSVDDDRPAQAALERGLGRGVRIIDISVPLTTAPVWPGEGAFVALQEERGGIRVSALRLGSHSGTHVDAPSHFIPGGRSINDLPLEQFVGEALVLHLPQCRTVGLGELEGRIPVGTRRVLLRTDNSAALGTGRFIEEYVSINAQAADYLVAMGIQLVGTDYLSIEAFRAPSNPVHRILLGQGIVILEGLDLSSVEPGPYLLVALPLPMPGVDGSPVRAVLLQGRWGDLPVA